MVFGDETSHHGEGKVASSAALITLMAIVSFNRRYHSLKNGFIAKCVCVCAWNQDCLDNIKKYN